MKRIFLLMYTVGLTLNLAAMEQLPTPFENPSYWYDLNDKQLKIASESLRKSEFPRQCAGDLDYTSGRHSNLVVQDAEGWALDLNIKRETRYDERSQSEYRATISTGLYRHEGEKINWRTIRYQKFVVSKVAEDKGTTYGQLPAQVVMSDVTRETKSTTPWLLTKVGIATAAFAGLAVAAKFAWNAWSQK